MPPGCCCDGVGFASDSGGIWGSSLVPAGIAPAVPDIDGNGGRDLRPGALDSALGGGYTGNATTTDGRVMHPY